MYLYGDEGRSGDERCLGVVVWILAVRSNGGVKGFQVGIERIGGGVRGIVVTRSRLCDWVSIQLEISDDFQIPTVLVHKPSINNSQRSSMLNLTFTTTKETTYAGYEN